MANLQTKVMHVILLWSKHSPLCTRMCMCVCNSPCVVYNVSPIGAQGGCAVWRKMVTDIARTSSSPRGTEALHTPPYANTLTNITLCWVLLSWELIMSGTLWLINVPERWASIWWALNRVTSMFRGMQVGSESRWKRKWDVRALARWIPKRAEGLSSYLNW